MNTSTHDMRYPTSKPETIADGVVHAISVTLAIIGVVWMWRYPPMWQSPAMTWAVGIFIFVMLVAVVTSAIYHMTPISPLRATLRRCDHAMIFVRIASCYTPTVVMLNTTFAYALLAGVWAVALFGAVQKLFFWQVDGKSSIGFYFLLSCAAILLIWPMWTLSQMGVYFMLIAGALNSIGAVFYSRKTLPYRYPIWHVFATAATVGFFASIVCFISA